ncbi:MAG: nuclear transport factor 2 family protein [Eubacteriales bacterium]|nr:nuclear transport factor 2 family protein [Eubacteriales bacterium]
MKQITEKDYHEDDFKALKNVYLKGVDLTKFQPAERVLLYTFATCCEALIEKDLDTVGNLLSADYVFAHRDGRRQNVSEYFSDVAEGHLTYHRIGIEDPVIEIEDDKATLTLTVISEETAYGERGTYQEKVLHHYENWDGDWVEVNDPASEEE